MSTPPRPRPFTNTLLAALLGSAILGGCQPSGSAPGTSSPPLSATPPASPQASIVVNGGTITLTDDACTWDGNPSAISAGRMTVAVRNQTDDFGLFVVHKLRPGRTFVEGQAAIAMIQEALKTGADWPEEVFEVSDAVTEATAEAGLGGNVALVTTAGTFGIVCSANTSPTGDVLTTFLVGPLEVSEP